MENTPYEPKVFARNLVGLSQTAVDKFIGSVMKGPNGCWVWIGSLNAAGYGLFFDYSKTNPLPSKNLSAHRMAYQLAVGPIPEGNHLHHICHCRPCVNPAHLQPVGASEHPGLEAKVHCKRGHLLEGDNVVWLGDKRSCKQCIDARRGALNLMRAEDPEDLSGKQICKRGHVLTPQNTSFYTSSRGLRERRCKICTSMAAERWREAHPDRVVAQKVVQRAKEKAAKEAEKLKAEENPQPSRLAASTLPMFCKYGHAYSDENTYWHGDRRFCRACHASLTLKIYHEKVKNQPPKEKPTHCPNGHPYDEKNTYIFRGRRACKQCHNKNCAIHYAKKKAARPVLSAEEISELKRRASKARWEKAKKST